MKWTWAFLVAAAAATAQAQTMNMQEVAQALGVRCEYCHSAPRGSGQAEPKKDIALAMMALTRDLNAKVQEATGKPANETARVECITCHRGVANKRSYCAAPASLYTGSRNDRVIDI